MFSRARLSAERMIAKLVRFANIEVSGALAEFALMRAASWASLAGPVRLPVPVKFSIANRALRHVLVNDSLRLGFSGFIFFGAWATDKPTIAIRTIVILM